MKLRQLILMAAFVLFCAPPWVLSQDQTRSQTDPKSPTSQSGQTDQNNTSTPSDQPSMPPAVPQKDDAKIKHDGGRSDVDAIGNRKIGGRGMGNWYSLEGEIRMGKEYAQQVEASVKLVQDPVVTEYVNRIGQNLVRNSDAQVPFTIKVID
ncbi:MAG: peptidase M48, partial [Acidobacteria bacterium]